MASVLYGSIASAQQKTDANVFGDVRSGDEHLPYVTITVVGTNIGTATDETGHYILTNLPVGKTLEIEVSSMGFKKQTKSIEPKKGETIELNFDIEESHIQLNEFVVSATRTAKRKTDSPVIVGVIDRSTLGNIQANTLTEGLCFSTGLRVETDCQTCNYTQLRMNGLGGSYSQILVNSRPMFSSVMGLYGLDQIPASMIDRIEIVRGSGSALYGSSAIGGTVNVITRVPFNNSYSLSTTHTIIDGAHDNFISADANIVSKRRNSGVALFVSRRERDYYDANNDNFSEFPHLKANTFGLNFFLKPTQNQKIELNLNSIYEYRYGGEMVDKAAYLAQQSEERTHNILMGGLDYELSFNDHKSSLAAYISAQNTKRKHYTGIIPDKDDAEAYAKHFYDPPYGDTDNTSFQAGFQINHRLDNFLSGTNTLTAGTEFLYDDILDEISAYSYKTDQTTRNFGAFLQSDWEAFRGFNLLLGARADKHNMVDKVIINPRVSLLYKLGKETQFRVSWASGFRAPQAFDTDMHMAFANGGVSRIRLADDLKAEKSNSYSLSVNYDKAKALYIWGFTFEGFYTKLNKAFALEQVGNDEFGDIFEKINSTGSSVKGLTLELRGNYNGKIQLEAGFTLQRSRYDDPIAISENLEATKKYLRTPERYGYYTLTVTPTRRFTASLSGVYTGPMLIMHAGGAPENPEDTYVKTRSFFDNNIKVSYLFEFEKLNFGIEVYAGVKNIFNAYQSDFDTGKNRDSNYIYGPGLPRSYFFGVTIKSL